MISSSLFLIFIVLGVLFLGALLFWALGNRKRLGPSQELEVPGGHAIYLSQIRQALDLEDLEFLMSRGTKGLARSAKRERAKVVLDYLAALQTDFQRMLRLARVIAVLSPEVAPAQEWERLRLSVSFTFKLEVTRLRVRFGWMALPHLQRVNRVVSGFAIRLEHAMTEMGERAALATEMASFT